MMTDDADVKETSGRESREGLVTSEQQDETPASTLDATDSRAKQQHLPRHIQYQQQQQPATVPASQRLKNPVTCRVLMLDGIEYELSVEVLCCACDFHMLISGFHGLSLGLQFICRRYYRHF